MAGRLAALELVVEFTNILALQDINHVRHEVSIHCSGQTARNLN
jgi:hypothetical protein